MNKWGKRLGVTALVVVALLGTAKLVVEWRDRADPVDVSDLAAAFDSSRRCLAASRWFRAGLRRACRATCRSVVVCGVRHRVHRSAGWPTSRVPGPGGPECHEHRMRPDDRSHALRATLGRAGALLERRRRAGARPIHDPPRVRWSCGRDHHRWLRCHRHLVARHRTRRGLRSEVSELHRRGRTCQERRSRRHPGSRRDRTGWIPTQEATMQYESGSRPEWAPRQTQPMASMTRSSGSDFTTV